MYTFREPIGRSGHTEQYKCTTVGHHFSDFNLHSSAQGMQSQWFSLKISSTDEIILGIVSIKEMQIKTN